MSMDTSAAQMRQRQREVDPALAQAVIDGDDQGRHIGAQRRVSACDTEDTAMARWSRPSTQ